MEFFIEQQPVFSVLRIKMSRGETFRAEAGAMVAMSPTISLEAKSAGKGFLGSIKAAVGGESFFAELFTAESDGELLLAPGVIGDITRLEMGGGTIFAQNGAYLAGSPDLELSTQGSFKAMLSGEGLFLQKITGSGILFLNSYGAIIERTLSSGETYIVDTSHIVAFEQTVNYRVKKAAKGLFSTFASGEGLVCEYTGPGKIWMQTRNLSAFAQLLMRFFPKNSN